VIIIIKKATHLVTLILLLSLTAILIAPPVQADPKANAWSVYPIPAKGEAGDWVLTSSVPAEESGVTAVCVAFDGTNLVAGEYNTTIVWRSANPLASASSPTVNTTSASNRPSGENKVVVDWAGSNVAAATSGNLSAFTVSTDNGTSFSDILVITDTSWDNDGWAIPGFDTLADGSHTIYFRASDKLANIEGESGEWDWQFYKGTPPSPP